MTRDLQKTIALAQWAEQQQQQRDAAHAAERQAGPAATDEHRQMRTADLFHQTFGHSRQEPPRPPAATDHPQDRPWSSALRLAADDDAPAPPEAPAAPAPPPVPPQETRARQTSADDLFAAMQQRLSYVPEAATLPPDAQLRRAFRELPGGDRERIAARIEAEDFGMAGYFAGRNFSGDYVSVLVGSALARRFADAQRLQPDLTPAELLRQIGAATAAE